MTVGDPNLTPRRNFELEPAEKRIETLEAALTYATEHHDRYHEICSGAMPTLDIVDKVSEPAQQKRPPRLSAEERERRGGGLSPLDRLGDPLAAAEKRIEELEAEVERLALGYIQATNPGIDIEDVKRTRALDREIRQTPDPEVKP